MSNFANMASEDYEKFIDQLKRHEGSKRNVNGLHYVYVDTVGKLTIGYGHNLTDNPIPGIDRNSLLTEAQATEIFKNDVKDHVQGIMEKLPWIDALDGPRKAVLLNMAFNLGVFGLLKWTDTLDMIEHGEYDAAAKAMLVSKWRKQVKGRALELAEQMRSGEWGF